MSIPGWAIFDLDGTLVDSQPHVLWSVRETARAMGATDVQEVRIGPPLKELLRTALSTGDEAVLAQAAETFKRVHDEAVGPGCKPYGGALELWNSLKAAGIGLAIATNKREAPARAILAHWNFGGELPPMVCADSPVLAGRSGKAAMIAALLAQLGADPARTLMLGDSHEDVQGGQDNGLGLLLFAGWGYGEYKGLGQRVASPAQALTAARGLYSGLASGRGGTAGAVAG